MVNKKRPGAEKAAKSSKSFSVVTKKTSATKGTVAKKANLSEMIVETKNVALRPEVQELFKDYYQQDGRIFLTQPRSYGELPDLLELQKKGYSDFINVYLGKLFSDVENIWDIAGDKLYVNISDLQVSEPIETVDTCRKKELTYGGIITAKVKLVERIEDEKTKKVSEKVLFNKRANIGILPLMTPSASYIINGVERVIISQIIRSYGIFYGKKDFWYSFKLIPENGPWLEVNVEKTGNIVARINKSRKFPITSLLRVFGLETDESIREVFNGILEEEDVDFIDITLKKDTTVDAISAAEHIYGKLRPGELIDAQSALDYVKGQFLLPERIYVGNIARRKINAKLNLKKPLKSAEANIFDGADLVEAVKYLVNLCNQKKGFYTDDSDHLSNKRVRTMGEILYSHLQPVMRKFVKSVRGKLSVLNMENPLKITDLVNFKMIDNSIKSFFATSQLSQFLDQINPLSEIEHKRRITALGPGGLKRETAKFEVRDVHPSHYGRICPIETPEGQNIGLVIYQSLYSRINDEGFLETPALKIFREVEPKAESLVGRIAHRDIYELDAKGNPSKKVIIKENEVIDEKIAATLEKAYGKLKKPIAVKPFFTGEIEYISPEMDEKCVIADATTPLDEHNNILSTRVAARHFSEMETFHVNDITHMDVNLSQIFSPNTSLIPFVDHNDAVRASVATNQQRQALPLLKNDAPLVGTGLERDIVRMTHAVIKAEADGEVIYVDGGSVKVKYKDGTKEYHLTTFVRSNHKTCITQVPCVDLGQKVKKGDLLAEGPCSVNGEMAVGKSLRVAFMPWKGYNYEDAIVISQRLIKDDELTSIMINEYEIEVAETKLGPEETTNDIPGVAMAKLGNLDEEGIIRIGSIVKGGDLLIGKITPKGEGELTPEEKLIQAIFGDKSKNVKDTSLYMPSGSEGKVVDVVILDAKKGDNLMAGVRKKIKVYVASTRKIEVGDKLAGKHGNKGIVAIVVPEENMPYSADGRPVDVVLNSLGVISRMNLGQLFESQLGLLAKELGVKFAVPTFGGFGVEDIVKLAQKAGLEDKLRTTLYDGETGEPYAQQVTVGYMHLLKLVHMVEDKIHARSVGPYSLITQQPLGGKSRQGGQRFGEMEVWALEAYSAVYTLQEMLTVKSDDVVGRNKLYESIIKSQKPRIGGLPESFNLLTYLFKGLGQNIVALTADELETIHQERTEKIKSLGLSGIMTASLEHETATDEETDESEDKGEMIGKVVEDLEDFGQIE
ncbi:DNA-directed RNA polymerase subunit beta [SR1 bacterium human oral taxon HOT-345]|nr:DNA-directed RNA polymerase subunit beta [SR1 bacterium human oral taxon HOT-345]